MTTLTIKPAVTFTAFRGALRNILQTTDNSFLNKLFSKDFAIEPVSANKVEIVTKGGQVIVALVAGKKVVVMKDQASKNSVNIGLTRQVSMNEFMVNENAFVLDLEANTVKSATVSTGWVPSQDVVEHMTVGAVLALSNITLASTKGSSGEIEHFVFSGDTGVATSGIVEVRAALTSIVEANGGFVVVEQAPKVRKARQPSVSSFAKIETSKGTTAEAWRVEVRAEREVRNAEAEAAKEAKLAQKILTRRNKEALKSA